MSPGARLLLDLPWRGCVWPARCISTTRPLPGAGCRLSRAGHIAPLTSAKRGTECADWRRDCPGKAETGEAIRGIFGLVSWFVSRMGSKIDDLEQRYQTDTLAALARPISADRGLLPAAVPTRHGNPAGGSWSVSTAPAATTAA